MNKEQQKVEKVVAQGNSDAEGSRREIRSLSAAEAPEFHGEKTIYSGVPFDFAQGTPSTSLRKQCRLSEASDARFGFAQLATFASLKPSLPPKI